MTTIDWSEEKEDGNFKPELSQAMDLMWWAKQVRIGRQLQGSDIDIRNKLLQLPANKKIVNGQLNGKFKTMFLGVEGNNYCLYRDVTTQVNDSIKLAMSESRQLIHNFHFQDSLISFLRQISPLAEEELSKLKGLTPEVKALIAVMLTFTKNPSIMIEGYLLTISEFLKKNIISYFRKFLYNGPWGQNVKHGGKWDFKRNKAPFNAVKKGANLSKFFHYKGYNSTYNLNMYGHKPGLLRYDDPGNMCYGATGKIMLSIYIPEPDRPGILEFAANFYAVKDEWDKIVKALFAGDKETKIKFDNFTKGLSDWIKFGHFDDPRDLKAIEYGYNNF